MNPCDFTDRHTIRLFRIAALCSYGIGYLYIKNLWDGPDWTSGILFFTILFILCTECFAFAAGRTPAKLRAAGISSWEGIFFAVCALVQAAAMYGYGLHMDMGAAQVFMWHTTMVVYVLTRTGMQVSGRIGPLFLLDFLQGFFALPFGNIHLRIVSIFRGVRKETGTDSTSAPALPAPQDGTVPALPEAAPAPLPKGRYSRSEKCLIAVGVLFGILLTAVVWSELTGVSSAFAGLDFGIAKALRSFYEIYLSDFFDDFIPKFLFSIPVGAWLFGLVGGSLRRSRPVFTEAEFENASRPWHAFPVITLYIVSGMLAAVYALFFAVSIRELLGLVNITAPAASKLAVNGFWQLVRIVMINIATLGVYSLFLKGSETNAAGSETGWSGVPRVFLTVQFAFTTAFALLAGWKLFGIYIGLFGPTPRRMLSGWFLLVLLLACVLILVRLYKKTAAARIVLLAAAASFSVLCCLPVARICP